MFSYLCIKIIYTLNTLTKFGTILVILFFFGNTLKAFLCTAVTSDICKYTQAVRLVLKAVQFGVNILFLDF